MASSNYRLSNYGYINFYQIIGLDKNSTHFEIKQQIRCIEENIKLSGLRNPTEDVVQYTNLQLIDKAIGTPLARSKYNRYLNKTCNIGKVAWYRFWYKTGHGKWDAGLSIVMFICLFK